MHTVDSKLSNFTVGLTWVGNFWNCLHYIPTKLKVTKTRNCIIKLEMLHAPIFKVQNWVLYSKWVGPSNVIWLVGVLFMEFGPMKQLKLTFNFNKLLFAPVKFPLFFGHEPTILCMFTMFLEDGRFSEWDRGMGLNDGVWSGLYSLRTQLFKLGTSTWKDS